MYCGSCGDYIPSGLGIQNCPKCSLPLDQSERLKAEKKERERVEEETRLKEIAKSKRVYHYFEAVYYSFFSKDFYLNVIRKWKGIGFAYTLFIVGLCLIPFSLGLSRSMTKEVNKQAIPVIKNLPVFTWSEGVLSINKPSPHTVYDVENKNIIAIIDTEGSYTDLTTIPAFLLMTQNQAAFRENAQGNVRVVRFSPEINFVLTPEFLEYCVRQFTRWFPYILFPFLWGMYVVGFLFLELCYAVLGLIVAFFMKLKITFTDLLRLSIIALTPVILVDGVICLWNLEGLPNWISKILPAVYLIAALVFYKRSEEKAAV